jgi:hypothetical protein
MAHSFLENFCVESDLAKQFPVPLWNANQRCKFAPQGYSPEAMMPL